MDTLNLKFNFPGILDLVTGLDGWESTEAPPPEVGDDTVGESYWFRINQEHDACVAIDSTFMRVVVDGFPMYDGDWSQDPEVREFVDGDLPPLENGDEDDTISELE